MSASFWYLDTSAFVKQLVREPESSALEEWLRGRSIVSSDLLRTEARRTVLAASIEARQRCEQLLVSVDLIRITPELFDRAGQLEPTGLRSLDALHLAAALALGPDLAGIVAYDRRLLAAAESLGVPCASPGHAG